MLQLHPAVINTVYSLLSVYQNWKGLWNSAQPQKHWLIHCFSGKIPFICKHFILKICSLQQIQAPVFRHQLILSFACTWSLRDIQTNRRLAEVGPLSRDDSIVYLAKCVSVMKRMTARLKGINYANERKSKQLSTPPLTSAPIKIESP